MKERIDDILDTLIKGVKSLTKGQYREFSKEKLQEIVRLGFGLEPEHYVKVVRSKHPLYRDMPSNDVHMAVFLYEKEDSGIHLCILKNGDIFARQFPYYDGDLDNLIMVSNHLEILKVTFGA